MARVAYCAPCAMFHGQVPDVCSTRSVHEQGQRLRPEACMKEKRLCSKSPGRPDDSHPRQAASAGVSLSSRASRCSTLATFSSAVCDLSVLRVPAISLENLTRQGNKGFVHLDPTRIEDCTLSTPRAWTTVWALPTTAMTSSQLPSGGGSAAASAQSPSPTRRRRPYRRWCRRRASCA